MTPEEIIDNFTDYLLQCGLKEKSVDCYRTDVVRFMQYLSQSGVELPETTTQVLLQWVSFIRALGDAQNTIGRKISAVRRFYEYANFIKEIDENPAVNLKTIRRSSPLPRTDRLRSAQQVLQSIEDQKNFVRENAIVVLAALAGLRASEIVLLKIKHFQLTPEGVLVTVPCTSNRTVHLRGNSSEPVIRHWVQRRTADPSAEAPFLLGRKGKPLCRQAIWKVLKNRSEQLGLPYVIGPIQLRGLFIQRVLAQDATLEAKAFATGIKDPSGLRLYTYDSPGARSGGDAASRVPQSPTETLKAYASL